MKIPILGGFALLICGRRIRLVAEKELLKEQTKLIERTRNAAYFHRELAEECNKNGLPILAREHDYVAKCLEEKVALQMRAFREDALK